MRIWILTLAFTGAVHAQTISSAVSPTTTGGCYQVTLTTGETLNVPPAPGNRHYDALQKWIAAGGKATKAGPQTTFTIDRWVGYETGTGAFTAQQRTASPPAGFTSYLALVVSTPSGTPANGAYHLLYTAIEGQDVADLQWGTASAKAVTLSFWISSAQNGTFGGSIQNSAATRSYPFSYTISSSAWTQIVITIPGDTSGTWLTTTGVGIYVVFSLGVGSTYTGTAGAWTGSNKIDVTGNTVFMATNGSTFNITGVQFEQGSYATDFDIVDYSTQLLRNQRYFESISAAANSYVGVCATVTGVGTAKGGLQWKVRKRVATNPTLNALASFEIDIGGAAGVLTAFSPSNATVDGCFLDLSYPATGAGTVGTVGILIGAAAGTNPQINIDADF